MTFSLAAPYGLIPELLDSARYTCVDLMVANAVKDAFFEDQQLKGKEAWRLGNDTVRMHILAGRKTRLMFRSGKAE